MKENFIFYNEIIVPINLANIDTDIIIPKQFLKKMEKTGFGKYLFYDWRYLNNNISIKNTKFILNNPKFLNAKILLTRKNFGCGSSREHAVWALKDFGIKAIISTSFADIFYTNAFNNNLLLITLDKNYINELFNIITNKPGVKCQIDLLKKTIIILHKKYNFMIDDFHCFRIKNNLDTISITLKNLEKIKKWEKKHNSIF